MKVKIVSDLHLEFCENGSGIPDLGEGQILILGGDILCARHFKRDGNLRKVYKDFLQKCADNFYETLYIAGNHEAYGYNYEGTWEVLKENLPDGVYLLENDVVKLANWNFIGSTFWTDFRNGNALEMMEAAQCMNDYKVIRIGPKYRKLTPNDTYHFHQKSKQFLSEQLKLLENKNIFVLTHQAPSYQSVHKKYKTSGITNTAYVSHLDDFILEHPQIKFWSHGHTHESFDYKIGECRVVCNPRGYYPNGLNPNFNPNFEVELD